MQPAKTGGSNYIEAEEEQIGYYICHYIHISCGNLCDIQ